MKRRLSIIVVLLAGLFVSVFNDTGALAYRGMGTFLNFNSLYYSPYNIRYFPSRPFNRTVTRVPNRVEGAVLNPERIPKSMVSIAIKKLDNSESGTMLWRQSDANGMYSVRLGDGNWIVSACGSPSGYKPIYWKVVVSNGDILSYEAVDALRINIDHYEYSVTGPNVRSGYIYVDLDRKVTLVGSGFGCSGKVLIDFGALGSMETGFRWLSDRKIALEIPSNVLDYVKEMNGGREIEPVTAYLIYVNGNQRSNPIEIRITRFRKNYYEIEMK